MAERGWRGARVAELERDYLDLDEPGYAASQDRVRAEMNQLRRQFDADDAATYQRRKREIQAVLLVNPEARRA